MATATMVRAKFRVNSVKDTPVGSSDLVTPTPGESTILGREGILRQEATLSAVSAPHEDGTENRSFWKATPNGDLRMTIDNPECIGFYQEGKEYYLDFIPVESALLTGQ